MLAHTPLHTLPLMSHQTFYTDMGPGIELRDEQGEATHLPRYGVWKWDARKGKHQVAEVGDDLEALRARHGEGTLVDMKAAWQQQGQAQPPSSGTP